MKLNYVVSHEAFYWKTIRRSNGPVAEIFIGHPDTEWEFAIEWHDLHHNRPLSMKLGMFDEAFPAFEQIPEFFEKLKVLVRENRCQPENIVELLKSLDAVDETTREDPDKSEVRNMVETLDSLIDGEDDMLAKNLKPIRNFVAKHT